MVEDTINKAGALPISGNLRPRDQLTIPHVSRFLCLFYGAYRSMLRKKDEDKTNKVTFRLCHAERPFYDQIYQVCDKIAITHNKKIDQDYTARMAVFKVISEKKLRTELVYKPELVILQKLFDVSLFCYISNNLSICYYYYRLLMM